MITERFRESASRLIRHFGSGGAVLLRRLHTLRNSQTGAAVTALAVAGARLAGVAAISLDAPKLVGRIPAGLRFTIAGDATVYETTAAVAAAAGTLADVPITPALALDAADDAAVTIVRPYGEWSFLATRGTTRSEDDLDGAGTTRRRYHLDATGAEVTPEQGDLLVEDGETHPVVGVDVVAPAGATVRFALEVGGGA